MKFYTINNDVKAVYVPESMGVLYFRADLEQSIADLLQSRVANTEAQKQLITDLEAAKFFEDFPIPSSRPIRTLYFCTSYNCNLACTYCLTHGSVSCGRMKEKLSNENIVKAIEQFTFLSEPDSEREVVIYGGEPTLYPEMIRFIYHTVREYEAKNKKNLRKARFILCTNGILIDDDLAQFIKESGIYPAVSFDGYSDLHDTNRKTPTGQGSFELAEKGYRLLERHGIQAGVTMALGSHTLDELPQIVKYLHSRFHPKTIAANSMLDFENNKNSWMPDGNLLPQKLWDTFLVCREEGIYLVKSIMDNRIKPFVEREPRYWGCTGTGARMGVLPDGNIVPCMALSHKYFVHIDKHPCIDDFCPPELKNSSPYCRSECTNCEAKATCGGGCPAAAILSNSPVIRDVTNCTTSKFFLRKMIELLWENIDCSAAVRINGYYIPTYADRRKLYGRIKINSPKMDFQYIPDVSV